jgi:hypothetical protein
LALLYLSVFSVTGLSDGRGGGDRSGCVAGSGAVLVVGLAFRVVVRFAVLAILKVSRASGPDRPTKRESGCNKGNDQSARDLVKGVALFSWLSDHWAAIGPPAESYGRVAQHRFQRRISTKKKAAAEEATAAQGHRDAKLSRLYWRRYSDFILERLNAIPQDQEEATMAERKDYEQMTDEELHELMEATALKVHDLLKREWLDIRIVTQALCVNLAGVIKMVRQRDPAAETDFTKYVYDYLATCIDGIDSGDNTLPFKH